MFGSSLKVTPAADLPVMCVEAGTGELVICNLQRTPKDSQASVLVRGRTDEVLLGVLRELGVELVPHRDHKRFSACVTRASGSGYDVTIRRCEPEGENQWRHFCEAMRVKVDDESAGVIVKSESLDTREPVFKLHLVCLPLMCHCLSLTSVVQFTVCSSS